MCVGKVLGKLLLDIGQECCITGGGWLSGLVTLLCTLPVSRALNPLARGVSAEMPHWYVVVDK